MAPSSSDNMEAQLEQEQLVQLEDEEEGAADATLVEQAEETD